MATLAQVREGLRARLATISGLRAYAYYPDTVSTPAAVVMPRDGEYNASAGGLLGLHPLTMEVLVLAAPTQTGYARGQEELDEYLSPSGAKSIYAAIIADRTLGGIVSTVNVAGWRDYGDIIGGDIAYWGARVAVEVYP